MKAIGQLALLLGIGENGIIYSSLMSNGEGEQAGMAFPMNPCSDRLGEGVIGFMKEIWIVVSGRAKIKQYRIACYGVECALNSDIFMLKAGIAE